MDHHHDGCRGRLQGVGPVISHKPEDLEMRYRKERLVASMDFPFDNLVIV
jgi:hypothetical protein